MVINDVQWKALQVPDAKYNIQAALAKTKPRTFVLTIFPSKKDEGKEKRVKGPELG